MGKYNYSTEEKEINKVLKLNEISENEISKNINAVNKTLENTIFRTEEKLLSLGYEKDIQILKNTIQKNENANSNLPILRSWKEISEEANDKIDYDVELEDILTKEEFRIALNDLDRIDREFEAKVKLKSIDLKFLFVATALQVLRWVLLPELGEKIDSTKRIDHKEGDKKAKEKIDKYAEKHKDWETSKEHQGKYQRKKEGKTWKEIIYSSVPYDATKGAPAQNVNMEGKYHRYKTLGHDPVLGWLFGTANILTDTITLNNFISYRVEKMQFTSEIVPLPFIFTESYEWIQDDIHRLPAAIFKQGVHLESDKHTKLGLPVPLLGVFNEELAGKLYRSQYDVLCLTKDIKKIGVSAGLSILINMIIGLAHGFYYNSNADGTRDLYEVRTRKILLYSNLIASSSNLISVYITKNPKKLDIGGLLITMSRLFTDIRFITRVKTEFINAELDAGMEKELKEIDLLFSKYLTNTME